MQSSVNIREILTVPVVDGLAGTLDAGGGTSPAASTALAVESSAVCGGTRLRGSLGLSRSGGGGLGRGVAASRALERCRAGNLVRATLVVGDSALVDVDDD